MTIALSPLRMFRPLIVLVPAVLVLFASAASAQEKPDLKRIDEQAKGIEKVVSDDYADETQLKQIRAELEKLLAATRAGVEISKDERLADAQTIRVQVQLLKLLSSVDARLLDDINDEQFEVRIVQGATFPIPYYSDHKLTAKAALELSEAQAVLRDQLTKAPDDEEKSTNLLVEMVLAQEKLAWEAGWPFTEDEAREAKSAKAITERVYQSRRDRGLKRINEHLRKAMEGVGRTPPRPFVIHQPASKAAQRAIEARLTELRGVGLYWINGTLPFDEKERDVLLGKRPPTLETEEAGDEAKPAEGGDEAAEKPADDAARTWRDRTGNFQIKAVFVSLTAGTVKLRRSDNGNVIEIPLDQLSDDDQKLIKSRAK